MAVVTVVPQGARWAVFELGLLCAAALAIWGGVVTPHAVQAGTGRTVSVYAGSIVGLVTGITIALVALSSGIGLLHERRPAG